ncbi:MAG TPA: 3-methyl-2-oxobutanoate hydroxymethyltransferase [Vicinamibacteria bacterium]|nr:3-methyl-2-oxobutanoate hydroxymethyltransferase [Vicinamibacteria bacterium]
MTKDKKLQIPDLQRKAREGAPITMITCYDYSMAHLVAEAGLDMVLVGDSLGMTLLGFPSTLPVTMDDMARHVAAVRRGAPNQFVVGDLPYMSYQPSDEAAVRNAGRLMAEGADAVKLEGGRDVIPRVDAMVKAGIPVMGHIGLTPQSASSLGGFRLQGKTADAAERLLEDASLLETAGVFSLLLELVPDRVCGMATSSAAIPIIGLGSGPDAHGQLLIFHDLFGLYPDFRPRMAKLYRDVGSVIRDGLKEYVDDVRARRFPGEENRFGMAEDELALLEQRRLGKRSPG